MHSLFQFAYLDPGTGSLIIQSIVGAIAGILVFGRRSIGAIKYKLFGGNEADVSATKQPKATALKSEDATD